MRERSKERDWFLVDLAMSSGLRVAELAGLAIEDLVLDGVPSVVVRRGKGGKRRVVLLDPAIAQHAREFLAWKRAQGEPVEAGNPVFWSKRTDRALTTRALQKAFKRCASRAELPERYSIHDLRHTYATHMLQASRCDLRFVQKQLGHSRLTTTQVYLHVLDARRAVSKPLYG